MSTLKNIINWFNYKTEGVTDFDIPKAEVQIYKKIAHYATHLEPPVVDKQKALNAFKANYATNKTITPSKVRKLNPALLYKVAAVIVVGLFSSYWLFFNNVNTISTTVAETQEIILPDQSEVLLNSNSKLTFNKKTWAKNRELQLDGEAYFKVEKGQRFTVETDAGLVQVLGTQFNVKERKDYFEVQCFEGVVRVALNNKIDTLTKGKSIRILDGSIEKFDINTLSPSWILQESSFNDIPLQQVIAELEAQFDIIIEANTIDLSKRFTGSFTHKNIETALKAVTIPLALDYKINGKKIIFYTHETP